MSKVASKSVSINAASIAKYRASLTSAFESRKQYESDKNKLNDSIQDTLDSMMKSFVSDDLLKVFVSANVNADFINRADRKNARFNVYSAEKVFNVARASVKAQMLNHYSSAILKSALILEKAEMKLTHKDASSACSLDCKTDSSREKLIQAAKYQRHIAANTASTQSSSSINALQAFDVLRETRDAANNVAYVVNRDSDVTKALCEALNVTL